MWLLNPSSQKVPVLVGCSNALVAVCNLSVTYHFPTWFQTVMLTSASTAGKINIIVEFFNSRFWPFFLFDNRTSSVTEFYLHFDWLFFCWVSCGDSSFSAPYLTEDVFLVWSWVMHRTGEYKMLNMIFGILPFFAAILMTQMKEDLHPAHLWLSIVNHFPLFNDFGGCAHSLT